MAGHSKWHNIQVRKGKQDKAKANVFTKLSRAITVAAKTGGTDPAMNVSLRVAIDKARAANMPSDNIDRAIERGDSSSGEGSSAEYALYEGYGPSGIAFLIEALTDNKTRTVSAIKAVFSKRNLSLGTQGSVQWMFDRYAVFRFAFEAYPNLRNRIPDVSLSFIDAGAVDILENEYGLEVRTLPGDFQRVSVVAEREGIMSLSAGFEWIPKVVVPVSDTDAEAVRAFAETLEELDDVEEVFVNI